MNTLLRLAIDGRGAGANLFVRVLVGAVFLSEGIQKLLLGLVFLLAASAGARSLDANLARKET